MGRRLNKEFDEESKSFSAPRNDLAPIDGYDLMIVVRQVEPGTRVRVPVYLSVRWERSIKHNIL
jgi:hypothetical protein